MFGITCCDDVDVESPGVIGTVGSFLKSIWWLIALIFVCIILGSGAYVLLSTKDEEGGDEDIVETLISYIEKTREEGFSDSSIRDKLVETGWDEDHINKAFENVRRSNLTTLKDRFEKFNVTNIF